MARILWLDDDADVLDKHLNAIRSQGHLVDAVTTDSDALRLLESDTTYDILIQDLGRPVHASEAALSLGPGTGYSGWLFYERILRVRYPHLPIIIFSATAKRLENVNVAREFNLRLVHKDKWETDRLLEAVTRTLEAERESLKLWYPPPAPVLVDFDKVSQRLIDHLALNPHDLQEVSWSCFETLVERLLIEMGYDVERTSLSWDGGADLWAFRSDALGETLYAIDAKKYSPNRLVGPEHVRAIYGVADLRNASAGMIVTTSEFGRTAKQLAQQYRYRIALRDYRHVTDWIRKVAKAQ